MVVCPGVGVVWICVVVDFGCVGGVVFLEVLYDGFGWGVAEFEVSVGVFEDFLDCDGCFQLC